VYQKGLGTLGDKARRIASLASDIAPFANADVDLVTRAAQLAKCDLLTGMVGEFPELQGTMGAYYALDGGENERVARAIGEQYLPRFAGDELPESAEGQVLAMADKLDTLAGVFAIGKKPTGNRDPFGLRRATLGIIRIVIEKQIEFDMLDVIGSAVAAQSIDSLDIEATNGELYEFFLDRLRRYLLDGDAGLSAEMFAAVRARQPRSLLDFSRRLNAVQAFMQLDEAASLAAANKRTANMLRQAGLEPPATDAGLLSESAELALHAALQDAQAKVAPLVAERSYTQALQLLAALREPVDTFFDDVMVMAEDEAVRTNRLALLAEVRMLFLGVADISRLTAVQE
jgi:glycyl-tRNA synthetase beta chain